MSCGLSIPALPRPGTKSPTEKNKQALLGSSFIFLLPRHTHQQRWSSNINPAAV